jgi:hydrogenase/urease accessory protein HupE
MSPALVEGRYRWGPVLRRPERWIVLAAWSCVLAARAAHAHPLAPALLQLEATGGGQFDVRWRVPMLRPPGPAPAPRLPDHCRPLAAPVRTAGDRWVEETWSVACDARGLGGDTLSVAHLAAPSTVVVRVVSDDGRVSEGVLTAAAPSFVVPPTPRVRDVVWSYVRLGLDHIATGPDHLLFVLGLVLLARRWRRIVTTVTAFTIGHSVTLALATFGLVRVPPGPIDFAIAASVFVVAVQVARRDVAGQTVAEHTWPIAACFGLLHGLGFAAALTDAGLPRGAIPMALFAFNVGIELGQLAFILLLAALWTIVRRWLPMLPAWTRRVPAYVMGTLAAYWCFERAAAWLGI